MSGSPILQNGRIVGAVTHVLLNDPAQGYGILMENMRAMAGYKGGTPMQSLLIKDTTRAQREEIVRRALSVCGDGCDGCNGCGNTGGGRVDSIYQPYIDGEKELAEINAAYAVGRKPVR